MRSLLQKTTTPYGLMISIACLLFFIFGIVLATHVNAASTSQPAAGERLLTIYDAGQQRALITHDTTLRQAFKDAHIAIDPHDMVEPSLDSTLVANSYNVNIYRARPVTIIDGDVHEKVMSPYQTAQQITANAGITMHDQDTATITANTDILSQGAGVTLTITRAIPFTLMLYGKPIQTYTQAKTVAAMLKQQGVTLAPTDTVSVPLTAPIVSGMTVELWRNGAQTVTLQQPVPFTVQQIQDANQPVGYKSVQTPGVAGIAEVTYQIVMQNGQEISRTQIQNVVTQQPVQEVDIVGSKLSLPPGSHQDWMSEAGVSPADYGYVNSIFIPESGWNPASMSNPSNPAYGYVGLGQTSLSKLSGSCPNWQVDPVCQIRFFSGYASSRYGSWAGAYAFRKAHGWW